MSLTRLSNATTERKNGSIAPAGLRWSGMVLYLVIVLCPRCFLSVHNCVVRRPRRPDRASYPKRLGLKAGAYCGYFGMMYGKLSCGTGTFEERQGGTE